MVASVSNSATSARFQGRPTTAGSGARGPELGQPDRADAPRRRVEDRHATADCQGLDASKFHPADQFQQAAPGR